MSKPIITNHDLATGQTTEREMTDEEFEIYQQMVANAQPLSLPDPK